MSLEPDKTESLTHQESSERAIGIIFLVCGLGGMYLSVISPLMAAMRQEPRISITLKGALVAPLLLGLGVVYTVFGPKATPIFGDLQHRLSGIGLVFSTICVGLGILLYIWLKQTLSEYGYQF